MTARWSPSASGGRSFLSATAFAHPIDGLTLFDSYHCSRYNTNTGVLTEDMFRSVFAATRSEIDKAG